MVKKKVALIYGITGQDGAYLARFLLSKNYIVHGVKRRSSLINSQRIDDIYIDPHKKTNFYLHYGDLTDSLSISNQINKIEPNEVYNLAAQSHVGVSFDVPEYTANVDALGTLRILESIRLLNKENKIKFYQAGTSEMYGSTKPPQNENSVFHPRSPYAVSKVFAHMITVNYREAYRMFACNGILFNHESPYRGETFVTQKIVKGMCAIVKNKLDILYLGNLSAKRDWGHAKDYVVAMWLMMQKSKPDDYVISTGKQYSVKEFISIVAKILGIKIVWKGKDINEKGYLNGKPIIKIDKKYFRPTEVESLRGDSRKAKKNLKWKPKYTIHKMVKEMVYVELKTYDK